MDDTFRLTITIEASDGVAGCAPSLPAVVWIGVSENMTAADVADMVHTALASHAIVDSRLAIIGEMSS